MTSEREAPKELDKDSEPSPSDLSRNRSIGPPEHQRPRLLGLQWPDRAEQRWQTVLMGIICGVTAIYAFVSFLQWRSMERALLISNRAYISVSNGSLNKNLQDWQVGDRPVATITLVNKGNGPALEITSSICADAV